MSDRASLFDCGEVLTFLELCLFLINCDPGSQALLANILLCCHLSPHWLVVDFPASCHHCRCTFVLTTNIGHFPFLVRWCPCRLVQRVWGCNMLQRKLWSQTVPLHFPGPLLPSCVTLGDLFNLSVSHFLTCKVALIIVPTS